METDVLQDLGFTQAEAKVYLKLLELGAVKVGALIEKTGLQSSTIHNTLHSLQDKGMVNYLLKGKIKIYQATDPKILVANYREKEKKLEELLPVLELKQRFGKEKEQVEMYTGIKGMINMLTEFIADAKKEDIFYFFAVDESGLNEEIQKFFESYDKKRKAKGLKIKGLAREEMRRLFEHRKDIEMRYVDYPLPSGISICNNKIGLVIWSDKPVGILVTSKQFVEKQVMFFEEMWKKGVK